jgi:hypothetical protein
MLAHIIVVCLVAIAALCTNANATFTSYRPSVVFPGKWRNFLPGDLTSPWWYDADPFRRLVACL